MKKTRIFIDCEFNGFGGELISIALVSEDGDELYCILPEEEELETWVKENVIPVLYTMGSINGAVMCSRQQLPFRIEKFLSNYSEVEIIADWPDDIKYFCQSIITGPGTMIHTPLLHFTVYRIDADSKVPHNALWDARGIMETMLEGEINDR